MLFRERRKGRAEGGRVERGGEEWEMETEDERRRKKRGIRGGRRGGGCMRVIEKGDGDGSAMDRSRARRSAAEEAACLIGFVVLVALGRMAGRQ